MGLPLGEIGVGYALNFYHWQPFFQSSIHKYLVYRTTQGTIPHFFTLVELLLYARGKYRPKFTFGVRKIYPRRFLKMYTFVLSTHNIVRWLVLIVGVAAIVMAFIGWFGKKSWSNADDKIGLSYIILMDVNLLLGLLLYIFLSPITKAAFANFGTAMGVTELRFFAVEHILGMVVAVILAHVGRALSKKASESVKKYRAAAIWYTVSILVILAMIPWDRPFWRGF
jgi:hypothetical protein